MSSTKFLSHITKAVEHNKANESKKSLKMTYKKMNGRTVKRKISPIEVRGNNLLAFDHKRNDIRSFKLEGIKHMEKAAFWKGFEKKAWHGAAELAGLGTLAAPSIQAMRGKPMSEKAKNRAEVAGLGILAAPTIAGMAKKVLKRG